jgi:hypothetical protein
VRQASSTARGTPQYNLHSEFDLFACVLSVS